MLWINQLNYINATVFLQSYKFKCSWCCALMSSYLIEWSRLRVNEFFHRSWFSFKNMMSFCHFCLSTDFVCFETSRLRIRRTFLFELFVYVRQQSVCSKSRLGVFFYIFTINDNFVSKSIIIQSTCFFHFFFEVFCSSKSIWILLFENKLLFEYQLSTFIIVNLLCVR